MAVPMDCSDQDVRARWTAEIQRSSETLVADRVARNNELWIRLDLTMQQLKALYVLRVHGPLPVGGLAVALRVHVSSVTGLVDRLDRQGLIRRTDDPADRRLSLLSLSGDGQQTVDRLYALHDEEWRRLAAGLSDGELEALAIGLAALAREVDRRRPAAVPLGEDARSSGD